MDVVVAGAHGKVALHTERLLAERGDSVRGLIRNPDHAADLEKIGVQPVICDMEAEHDLRRFVEGSDAIVFAAGAGPGSGPERKRTVDYGAAVKLMDAGVSRYVIVSSIGAGDPSSGPESMQPYLEAKHDADEALVQSGLDYTIVRPGSLTDASATGHVAAGPDPGWGEIPRADVALVLVAVLDTGSTVGKTFTVIGGDQPIDRAIAEL
jgi:uncharacterized protein YbjT (DUF2867 family)